MKLTGTETDRTMLAELGARIRRLRLDRNITQARLAEEAGISRPTVQAIEDGKPSQLVSVIRVLRVLGVAANVDELVPEPTLSPIELLEMRGRQRRRASGLRSKPATERGGDS